MRKHTIAVLLALVLAALASDITIRSRTVHAQSSPNLHMDIVGIKTNIKNTSVTIHGFEVVAMSCATEFCYVLSK
jgi:hypothetical protein